MLVLVETSAVPYCTALTLFLPLQAQNVEVDSVSSGEEKEQCPTHDLRSEAAWGP
jgi:hypothetical protein